MGIRAKRLLIKPGTGTPLTAADFVGKRIAIDTTLYMTKLFKCSDRWLLDFECMLRNFVQLNVSLVCVFDGRTSPDEKRECSERRRLRNDEGLKKIERSLHEWSSAKRRIMMESYSRRFRHPTREDKHHIYALVQKYNFELCFADSEGEALCCGLLNIGEVDYVLTEDSDIIVYNPKHFLHYFRIWQFIKCDYSTNVCEQFFTKSILDRHHMTIEDLWKLVALTGCDYTTPLIDFGGNNNTNRIYDIKHLIAVAIANNIDMENNLSTVKRMFVPTHKKWCFEPGGMIKKKNVITPGPPVED